MICGLSTAHRYVPGIVALICVEEMLVTVIAVSVPYVASPVNVTEDPPFCEVGTNPVPVTVIETLAHVDGELNAQYAALAGLTGAVSCGNGFAAP